MLCDEVDAIKIRMLTQSITTEKHKRDIWCGIIMIGVLSFTILLLAITLNMVSDALRENIAVLEKKVANIEAADATISTINGVDYYTFDHDGQHYVVEVG